MFDIKPTAQQREYALWQHVIHDCIKTNTGEDGKIDQQVVGFLGQTVVADLLNVPRPILGTGFDGGVDFVINGKTIDLKVKQRNTPVQGHYACDLFSRQQYGVDYYMFASYNRVNKVLTIIGLADQEIVKRKAEFIEKGEMRFNDKGEPIEMKGGCNELKVKDLIPLNSVEDIRKIMEKSLC